jgi:DNA modification methylase
MSTKVKQHYIIDNAKNVGSILQKKGNGTPQLIISSPPYFDLLNYNNNKKQLGYGQESYDEFLDEICQVFQDCYESSAANATFWLIVDTFKKDKEVTVFPFDIVNKLKANADKTWLLRDIIIWDKGKNLPWNQKGNFKNQHEYILFFTKDDNFKFKINQVREIADLKKWWKTYPERYNPDGKAPSNIWSYTTPIRGWGNGRQNHLCPFPFPLVEKIISLCSDENDWVLDPFVGSGSVLAIAAEMGRNSIGIDVNKSYKERFEKEVRTGASQYWTKRVKELKETAILFANFKETNKKLRKLKVASNICGHLNKINAHDFVYYTKDSNKNEIEIIVLQNGRVPKIDINDKGLQALIKQSKITPTVRIEKDIDFVKTTHKKAYKYKLDKFFSYTSPCQMKDVLKTATKYEYMYSDIEMKIISN